MANGTTTYWRLRLADDTLGGLIRRRDVDGAPAELAYLREDGWREDGDLARLWLDPGDLELVEVSDGQAGVLAWSNGHGLADEATAA